jgi:VanZ family protein
MLISVTTMPWMLIIFSTALRQSNNALKILLYLSATLPLSLKAYNFASTQTREIHKRGRELIHMMYALVGCTCVLV